jgi:hypothetical protein
MVKSTALCIGSGGFDTIFEHKDGSIYEKQRSNYTSAYMLVYIRDEERAEIMRDIYMQDIPAHLKTLFDEENQINSKLEDDLVFIKESGTVHLVTFDIFKGWTENGLMQTTKDIYEVRKLTLTCQ